MKELQLLAATGLDTAVWIERTIMKEGRARTNLGAQNAP